ncbi:pantoate--beta-alanine ligase [Allomuricauda sp. d1]|uniref:pantoate--beta-alanine ligase n=1 Tax=Allomuricauda sp. d1 TaxID=3136725 RepID=UPI0031D346C5
MLVTSRKTELQSILHDARNKNHTIGLVPTMGALHSGHLTLVKRAVSENDVVVVSIFINPTQFDNQEDLEKYPRDFDGDAALLKSISEHIIIFAPTKEEIYNGDVKSDTYHFDGLEKVMEGTFRKGHFEGVATIVELLFKAVAPDRAYFGEKDFQQLQIIKKLVASKNIPLEIVPCPIEREENGLAMSSRNERLPKSTREQAGFIYHALKTAKNKFGTESANDIAVWVENVFDKNKLFELEYFEIADVHTLTPITKRKKNQKYRAFIAVYADDIRLIDNIALN